MNKTKLFRQSKCFLVNQDNIADMSRASETFFCNLDDYQQLAPGEEKDLDVTMSRYECAISNIEAFTEKLSRDLSLLDGVCI